MAHWDLDGSLPLGGGRHWATLYMVGVDILPFGCIALYGWVSIGRFWQGGIGYQNIISITTSISSLIVMTLICAMLSINLF